MDEHTRTALGEALREALMVLGVISVTFALLHLFGLAPGWRVDGTEPLWTGLAMFGGAFLRRRGRQTRRVDFRAAR